MRGDNVVKDQAMTDAFKQGFAEGMGTLVDEQKYLVTVSLDDTKLVEKEVNGTEAVDIVQRYIVEAAGPGLSITITSVIPQAVEEATDDDEVVDAELVE